jgi:hypothetical protein
MEQTFGSTPDRIPAEYDPVTDKHEFWAQRAVKVKPDWAAIAGDAVHNLYSALDYLAWELVRANGGVGTNATSFPIFQEEVLYRKEAPRKIKGMHADAQRIIEQLQPFKLSPREAHPSEHFLAVLYELEQADKHRSLNLTTIGIEVKLLGFLSPPFAPPGPFQFPVGDYDVGRMLGFVRGVPAPPAVNLTLEVTHVVRFANEEPTVQGEVVSTLDGIRRDIENLIPRFQQFFTAQS